MRRLFIYPYYIDIYRFIIIIIIGFHFFGIQNLYSQSRFNSHWSETAKSLSTFQPGDAVLIQIWELYQDERRNINLSGQYPIDTEGFIIMPIIGEVKVKGLTSYELMQTLKDKFVLYLKNPYIYVRPLIRVTLQGAFNRPGSYRVDPSRSLWDLIDMAGGPASNCDIGRIRVERGGDVVIEDLLNSFEKGYSLEEIGVETGDQIIAPARGGWNLGTLISVVNLMASMLLLFLRLRTGVW